MRPAFRSLIGLTAHDLLNRSHAADTFDLCEHMDSAMEWILRAWKATTDDGISKGYSLLTGRWAPSYPETSGYTIPTLLDYYQVTGQACYRDAALRVADYLLTIQQSGGIPDWRGLASGAPVPVVFDTGQVIFGWLAAFGESGDERYLRSAVEGADWLVGCQHKGGFWAGFQHLGTVKVIDTRVAWALLHIHQLTSKPEHLYAARRNLDWAATQQQPNGWFYHCSFRAGAHPITHTIAYTAEGLLESGVLLGEDRYTDAARRTADALLIRQRPNGSLSGAFDSRWHARSLSSCLTGNCQMARVWLRLYQLTAETVYLEAASKAIAFVASTQNLVTADLNVRGGIKGSHPAYGSYERYKYPNWAAKFLADALLLWAKVVAVGSASGRTEAVNRSLRGQWRHLDQAVSDG